MKTAVKAAFAAVAAAGMGLSLVHPAGAIKSRASTEPLLAGAEIDPTVKAIFERSCRNCHSEQTQWPWYSYVAPLSWLIEADVHAARSHMNLSHWPEYAADQRIGILTRMAVEVRNRRMPLPRYLKLHADARLSDDEIDLVSQWAHRERARLKKARAAGQDTLDP